MSTPPDSPRPPAALRRLASWQAGRLATIGTRLTASRMPLEARSDFAVLACLAENGPLSQADLCRYLGLDRSNVNGIVSRLEQATRAGRRTDSADRRRTIVDITPEGQHYLNSLEAHADSVQRELLAPLSEREQEQLTALLDKVLSAHGPLQA